MDPLLTAVSALSLAMAIAMGFVVARLLREERERSDARVAALSAMAADPLLNAAGPEVRSAPAAPAMAEAHSPSFTATLRHPPEDLEIRAPQACADDLEIRASRDGAPHAVGTRAYLERAPHDLETWDGLERDPHARVDGQDLFAQHNRSSAWGPRLAVIGTLAAVLAAIGFAAVSVRTPSAHDTPPATTAAQSARSAEIQPLELLSLRYAQQAEALTISGLVQNPRSAAPLSRVVATAFVFGPGGTLLSSGKAPLDFTTLAPGDESPFVISVPVTGDVARYRIGFRTEDGRVIAHVDKRADAVVSASSK